MASSATVHPFQLYIPDFAWNTLSHNLQMLIYFECEGASERIQGMMNFAFTLKNVKALVIISNQLLAARAPHSVSYLGGK